MIDQVKVIEIGADAIEAVLLASPVQGLAYPPKLMHAVVAALGRHGYIVEDRYEEEAGPAPPSEFADSVANDPDWPETDDTRPDWVTQDKTAPDWDTSGDDM